MKNPENALDKKYGFNLSQKFFAIFCTFNTAFVWEDITEMHPHACKMLLSKKYNKIYPLSSA